MSNTALLVMDVQLGIMGRVQDENYVPRLAEAVKAARGAGIPVIYVVIAFRPGHPECAPRNKNFGALPPEAFLDGDTGTAIHPEVAPLPGETVVTKKRVSAFTGSDLALVLRSGDIDHLVLTGVATGGVVLSTLREAADLDYRLTVLSDGCYDTDPEIHELLIGKVFARQAEVTTIQDWSATLS